MHIAPAPAPKCHAGTQRSRAPARAPDGLTPINAAKPRCRGAPLHPVGAVYRSSDCNLRGIPHSRQKARRGIPLVKSQFYAQARCVFMVGVIAARLCQTLSGVKLLTTLRNCKHRCCAGVLFSAYYVQHKGFLNPSRWRAQEGAQGRAPPFTLYVVCGVLPLPTDRRTTHTCCARVGLSIVPQTPRAKVPIQAAVFLPQDTAQTQKACTRAGFSTVTDHISIVLSQFASIGIAFFDL